MYLERRAEQLTAAAATRAANQASAEGPSDGATTASRGSLGSPAARPDEPRVSPHDIEEAENLMESYFMQVRHPWFALSATD